VVLEGVENMGSTGGIRAISLAFAQNWSGCMARPGPLSGRDEPPSLRPPPLCAFVFFQDFFVMLGCFPRRDVARRIMGKDNIMAVRKQQLDEIVPK